MSGVFQSSSELVELGLEVLSERVVVRHGRQKFFQRVGLLLLSGFFLLGCAGLAGFAFHDCRERGPRGNHRRGRRGPRFRTGLARGRLGCAGSVGVPLGKFVPTGTTQLASRPVVGVRADRTLVADCRDVFFPSPSRRPLLVFADRTHNRRTHDSGGIW